MTAETHGDIEPFSFMGVLQQPSASGGPSPAPAPAATVPPLIDMDKINPPAVRSVHEVGANVACLAKFSGVYRECSTNPDSQTSVCTGRVASDTDPELVSNHSGSHPASTYLARVR